MDLTALLSPKSIAFYGGKWADIAVDQCRRLGFQGPIWRINPRRAANGDPEFLSAIDEASDVPDAAFVAVSREAAVAVSGALSKKGVGGIVCFASGFDETRTEAGIILSKRLGAETGEMPFLGPNCYGFINYFDTVSLWPDEIVHQRVERGVGFISQSGTIAITMAHNQRSLPLGYVVSAGNQARVSVDDLMLHMAHDDRVTAIGLYLEGVRDPDRFVETVEKVRALGKPIALLKTGRTSASAQAALTHTGSLSGSDAVFDALCERLGIARCNTLSQLCETLKLLHQVGPLSGDKVLVLGSSGGDMAITTDLADGMALDLAPIPAPTETALRDIYGDRVVYSNPFDMHIYSWYDHGAMTRQIQALSAADYDALVYVLDTPDPVNSDPSAFVAAIDLFLRETRAAGQVACMMSSLPELTPKSVRERILAAGSTPLQGLPEGLFALEAAAGVGAAWNAGKPIERINGSVTGTILSESEGKKLLAGHDLPIPRGAVCETAKAGDAATALGFPVVVKALSAELAHKTEAGGVALGRRTAEAAQAAADTMTHLSDRVLVEEMITDGVAEILVGLTRDAQFGLTLVIGSGGTMTEIYRDAVTCLFPVDRRQVRSVLERLTVWPLIEGFRGKPSGDVDALIDAILGLAAFAKANDGRISDLDINPMIVRPAGKGVVAVDVLLKIDSDQTAKDQR